MKFLQLTILLFFISNIYNRSQNLNFECFPENIEPVIEPVQISEGLVIYKFEFPVESINEPIEITWQIPALNMHCYWTTKGNGFVRPNWNSKVTQSHTTSSAPVVALIDNNNHNRHTFAASDALNQITFYSGVIEETAEIENKIVIDNKAFLNTKTYQISIRIDQRNIPYWEALKDVSNWWAGLKGFEPMAVPDAAKLPMYSTWYNFHQQLDVQEIIDECKVARSFGCTSVIVDDGWQTNDNNRGYMFAGDWKPERIPEMKRFVDSIHAIGMKFILWYSVPFVGKKTEAYKRFHGKMLSENVLDPRYPEAREYLINTYVTAMKDWGLDGFKLDFVDQFIYHQGTPAYNNGMDYSNVYDASDRLMSDISKELQAINNDVLIEFRQVYIGPLMRKYGNMFRAADCPYSIHTNRDRITNIRLLAGNTATHSDMIMWHPGEPVDVAAQQLLHVMFSVPQISVKLDKYPKEHINMLDFWLSFWVKNRDALIEGDFCAYYPNLNYPLLTGETKTKLVAGIYSPHFIVPLTEAKKDMYFLNATGEDKIFINQVSNAGKYKYIVYDCKGKVVEKGETEIEGGQDFFVPNAGLLHLWQ